jgi:cytochrome c oxidase assembly protein subunit 15
VPAAPGRELRDERQAWAAIAETPDAAPAAVPATVRVAAALALALLALQIFLGGWTSSNYAALACPDLPTCQGQWWPDLHLKEAFYEHGAPDNPARMTIHQLHRVGAFIVMIVFVLLGLWLRTLPRFRRHGQAILSLLALQLTLGVCLVLLHLPLLVAAAHNAGAALLLLAVITLNHAAHKAA